MAPLPSPAPAAAAPPPAAVGVEWVVDAVGCDPARLRDPAGLRRLCDRVLADLRLTVVRDPLWHPFPGPGGVTGVYLLAESHLTCHTYPEHALATFNLYCCRPRPRWDWEGHLADALGAAAVRVRELDRGPGDGGGR